LKKLKLQISLDFWKVKKGLLTRLIFLIVIVQTYKVSNCSLTIMTLVTFFSYKKNRLKVFLVSIFVSYFELQKDAGIFSNQNYFLSEYKFKFIEEQNVFYITIFLT
jgi:hypothetical protein